MTLEYVKITRPHNVVGAMLADLMGYLSATRWHTESFGTFLLSLVVVGTIAAAGYVVNDIYDIEIDSINKPNRPLPSGRIKKRNAWIFTIILFGVGIMTSFFTGIATFLLALITSFLLYEYARDLKRMGLPGNLVVGLTSGLSVVYGGVVGTGSPLTDLIPFIFTFYLTLIREFTKGVEDYEGDSKFGVRTLATTRGMKNTMRIIKIMTVLLMGASPLPFFLLRYNLLYLLLIVPLDYFLLKVVMTTEDNVTSAVRALKASGIIGIFAFIFGSAPIG